LAGNTVPSYYSAEKVQRILDFAFKNNILKSSGNLVMRRDLAFIWSLAETGLRVSEACNLKIGQIDRDWRATFIGKRKTQRSVRFGKNSRDLITAYLKSRKPMDESTNKPRSDLPLFARHDKTNGKNMIKPINSKIGEKIVHNLALLALGDEYDERITAHKFRHYYISNVLRVKGMRAAQIGAGHKNISTTEIYAHMSDEEVANINVEVFG
jgi:site-specific recombinase XerD